MSLRWIAGLAFGLSMLSGSVFACPLAGKGAGLVAESTNHIISIRTKPTTIEAGQPFSVLLRACRKNGLPYEDKVKASAVMPAHKHGMNYRPSVSRLGKGEFRFEGFLFHMPGKWQFVFDLGNGGDMERMLVDYTLK